MSGRGPNGRSTLQSGPTRAANDDDDIYFADESISIVEEWMQSNKASAADGGDTGIVLAKSAPIDYSHDVSGNRLGLGGSLKRSRDATGSNDVLEARLLNEKKKLARKQNRDVANEVDFHGIIEDDVEDSRAIISSSLHQKRLNKKKEMVGSTRPSSASSSAAAPKPGASELVPSNKTDAKPPASVPGKAQSQSNFKSPGNHPQVANATPPKSEEQSAQESGNLVPNSKYT
jgi:hypothetical protein